MFYVGISITNDMWHTRKVLQSCHNIYRTKVLTQVLFNFLPQILLRMLLNLSQVLPVIIAICCVSVNHEWWGWEGWFLLKYCYFWKIILSISPYMIHLGFILMRKSTLRVIYVQRQYRLPIPPNKWDPPENNRPPSLNLGARGPTLLLLPLTLEPSAQCTSNFSPDRKVFNLSIKTIE